MSIQARFIVSKGDFNLNADLEIPAKGITAIFGPSGSGKSTLLRCIAGLERPKEGFIKIAGDTWQDEHLFIPAFKRSLGYVFQEPSLFPHLSVLANLEYGFRRVPENERKISLDSVIELMGICSMLKRNPDTLSGGERQRVAIARALAVSPKLLLMDEPLSSLDQKSKNEILPYLEALHNELVMPVIYVSHSENEVARLADYLVLLEAGRVIASGVINEILTRLDLSMAHSKKAEAIIEATVTAHDDQYGLNYFDFPGGRFTVAHEPLGIGKKVRLRIVARDVSLTLNPQRDTSILNIFPVRVEEIVPEGDASMIVKLNAAGIIFLALVTRKSADLLKIKPGNLLYAQVKSVALLA